MSSQPARNAHSIRSVLRIPAFRRLWVAQLISVFGDFLAFFAASSFVSFRLKGTPAEVTGILVAFMIPFALIGPIAGVFVDRWDPKRTMIASDLLRAAIVLGLVFAREPWQIYASFLALSVVSAFFFPAQMVTTPMVVPKEALIDASAAMQVTVQAVRTMSPAIAGAIAGWLDERVCYLVDTVSFTVSAALIARIAVKVERTRTERSIRSVVRELNSGLRYVAGHAVIAFVVSAIAAGTFAISAFSSLLAVYVRDVLHRDTYVFGAMGSAVGLGALAGSVAAARLAKRLAHPAYSHRRMSLNGGGE